MTLALGPAHRTGDLSRNLAHISVRGLDEEILYRVRLAVGIEFASAREVPLDGGPCLAVPDTRIDHIERRGKPDNGDLGIWDRLPVTI